MYPEAFRPITTTKTMQFLAKIGGILGSKTLHMNSERLGEIFEGDFADTYDNRFTLVLRGDEQPRHAYVCGDQGPPSA